MDALTPTQDAALQAEAERMAQEHDQSVAKCRKGLLSLLERGLITFCDDAILDAGHAA